jgi:hypothetical protein
VHRGDHREAQAWAKVVIAGELEDIRRILGRSLERTLG